VADSRQNGRAEVLIRVLFNVARTNMILMMNAIDDSEWFDWHVGPGEQTIIL
jgi:hypothetical protein